MCSCVAYLNWRERNVELEDAVCRQNAGLRFDGEDATRVEESFVRHICQLVLSLTLEILAGRSGIAAAALCARGAFD